METIKAHGKFHAAHRQLDYDGKCAYVHGHTWRGTFVVRAERFPRLEKLDMSLDFGALKGIFKFLDHKMLIAARDETFLNAALFEPEDFPGSALAGIEGSIVFQQDGVVVFSCGIALELFFRQRRDGFFFTF